MASEKRTALVTGSSVKAALDLDWDDPGARQQALTLILDTLTTVEHWLACQPAQAEGTCQVATSLAVAHQVQTQDITLAPMDADLASRGSRRSTHQRGRRRDAPRPEE